MNMTVDHDKRADTVYLQFSHEKVAYTRKLDRERIVDYSRDGEIRGIRFLSASSGVNVEGLPHRSAIERAFHHKGFARHAPGSVPGGPPAAVQSFHDTASPASIPAKSGISGVARGVIAVMVFFGCTTASVLLARNMFILSSLPGLLASILGLVIALTPTVLGCLFLLAWVFNVRDQDSASSRDVSPPRGSRRPRKFPVGND